MAIAAGAKIDQSDFGFKSWTPSFSGLTLGSGNTVTGWYTNVGGLVNAHFHVLLGTGAAFTSSVVLDLPVASNASALQAAFGSWVYRDTSAVTHYAGTVAGWDAGGTQASFSGAWNSTSNMPTGRIGGTNVLVTPGSGDVFSSVMTYRAA